MPAYRNPPWGGPLAPLVDLTVTWGTRSAVILGILDTGADQTQIPIATANAVVLRKLRDKLIMAADGQQGSHPVYAATLEFDGRTFVNLPVVGTHLPIALVGRDILNQVAVLDGPRLTYSV